MATTNGQCALFKENNYFHYELAVMHSCSLAFARENDLGVVCLATKYIHSSLVMPRWSRMFNAKSLLMELLLCLVTNYDLLGYS